ncbi:MAG: hypothetical protein ACRD4Y_18485, partial [Candidatus Acidiferrales bacterium]
GIETVHVPRTLTTKKLAQRIDLDYFKRPSPFRRWRFWLSVALPAAAVVWLGWHSIRSDRRVYSAGQLSTAHAVLTRQCAACHATRAGFFSEQAADKNCLACHDGAVHQASQEFTPSCASCHAEHRGAVRLAAMSDAHCTQCHANLTSRGSETKYVRKIDSFDTDHPEFAALRSGKGDPGTIKLNHYRHLQPNLLGPNGVRVQMVCTDCHRSEADSNGPWPYGSTKAPAEFANASPAGAPKPGTAGFVSPRAYMAPATYARTCAACHTLQFDKRIPDEVPHDTPQVIHPFIVAKLDTYIAAHPGELRVPRDPSRDLPGKSIPAAYRLLTPQEWVRERAAEAEQLLWRKTCKQCHTLIFANGAALPKIAPSSIATRYMPHANFDHSQHGLVSCESCHQGALTSQLSSDVLLPGIAACRACHHPGAEAAESRCFECHNYHDPAHSKPAHSNFSIAEVEGRSL